MQQALHLGAKSRSVGILVLDEFICLEDWDFIESVRQSRDNAYIRWRDPASHPEEGFTVPGGQCNMIIQGNHIDLHLFLIPPSLPAKFNLTDLIPPVEIAGCLLIANRHFGYKSWNRIVNGPRKRSKNTFASWLAWIKAQKVPFLIAATGGGTPPVLTLDQLRDYLDLEPQISIMEIPSQFTIEQEYVHDLNEAQRVLETLVENIITGTA